MDDNVILEREAAGLRVELSWLSMLDMVALRVYYDGRSAGHTVPLDRVMDAFHHPMRYLDAKQLDALAVT